MYQPTPWRPHSDDDHIFAAGNGDENPPTGRGEKQPENTSNGAEPSPSEENETAGRSDDPAARSHDGGVMDDEVSQRGEKQPLATDSQSPSDTSATTTPLPLSAGG